MAYIDDDVLQNIHKLLNDCGRQFRTFEKEAGVRLEGHASLTEQNDATNDVAKYKAFSEACEKYAAEAVQLDGPANR